MGTTSSSASTRSTACPGFSSARTLGRSSGRRRSSCQPIRSPFWNVTPGLCSCFLVVGVPEFRCACSWVPANSQTQVRTGVGGVPVRAEPAASGRGLAERRVQGGATPQAILVCGLSRSFRVSEFLVQRSEIKSGPSSRKFGIRVGSDKIVRSSRSTRRTRLR